jgi:hypothetical protein
MAACTRAAGILLLFTLPLVACRGPSDVAIRAAPATAPVQQLPIRVGVYYPPETRAYRYTPLFESYLNIELGQPTVALFDQVFDRMFATTIPITQRPPLPTGAPQVDAAVELSIENYDFVVIPEAHPYAMISYRLVAYDADGTVLASWATPGVAKPDLGASRHFITTSEMAAEASAQAMTAAASRIADEFRFQPGIERWLESRGIKVGTP